MPGVVALGNPSIFAWRVLHQIQVHQYLEGQALAATGRWGSSSVVEFSHLATKGQPCYLGDVRGIVRPSPQEEAFGVLSVQRYLVNVVQLAGTCHCPFGDALVPGVQRNSLQAKLDVVLKAAEVTMGKQPPRPDEDVQVAVGEPVLVHGFVAVMMVSEIDEEVLREVLD